jgi:tetratricopeptide (TPR) repeat protein
MVTPKPLLRKVLLTLGILLVVYSSAWLIFDYKFRYNPTLERWLMHFGIGDTDHLRDNGYRQIWEGDEANLKAGVETFREALRRDSASPYSWCDLAEALLKANQRQDATRCMAEALKRGPYAVPILLRAGVFYFQLEQPSQGLQCLSRVLEQTAEDDAQIFEIYTSPKARLDDVLHHGLPALERPARAFFRHLLARAETGGVQKAWLWIDRHQLADDPLTGEYVDFLLKRQQYQTAVEVWVRQLGPRKGEHPSQSLLFNGDFEWELTGGVLDWRIGRVRGAETKRSPAPTQSGRWSLEVHFEGKENVDYHHLAQRVVVEPGAYRFEGWIKTEGITTDQGIGWRIHDAENTGRLDLVFDNRVGTSDWTQTQQDFQVGRSTRLLEVQLIRRPSLKFDNQINGTAWVDNVRLRRQGEKKG